MTDEDIQKAWRDIGGADDRMILPLYEFARAIIAQARAELIAEIMKNGPEVYKWRTAARTRTGTPGPWHLSQDPFAPVPCEVDQIACYAIPKE